MDDFFQSIIAVLIAGLLILGSISTIVWGWNTAKVYSAEMSGKAQFAEAEQNRKILIEQARSEKEAAKLQAEAIKIMGEAAQQYPEYRQQEFISAFGQALRDGTVNQIIYVPTEANIPVLEAGKRQ